MIFDFDNDGRTDFVLSESAGWRIAGAGNAMGYGASIDVANIGVASVSAGLVVGRDCWIQVDNKSYPTAEHLVMPDADRTRLPKWKRYYWLVMESGGLSLGAGLGFSFPVKVGANIDFGREQDPSGGIDFVHRWPYAPREAKQEQGDPTGFLGAALQDGVSGSVAVGAGGGASAYTFALGARIRGVGGLAVATATRVAQIMTRVSGIDHLAFQYGAAYWGVGPGIETSAGVSVSATMQIAYVHRLHAFVIEPELLQPLYCYTVGLRSDGSEAKYFDRDMRSRFAYYDPELIDDLRAAMRTDASITQLEQEWDDLVTEDGTFSSNWREAVANQNNRLFAYRKMRDQLEEQGPSPLFRPLWHKHILGYPSGRTLDWKIDQLESVRRR